MTLTEQIIRELFQSPQPEHPQNIQAVFYKFNKLVTWERYKQILSEYRIKTAAEPKALQEQVFRPAKPTKSKQGKVISFAEENGGMFTKIEINKMFIAQNPRNVFSHVSGILSRMLKSGQIERVGVGKYKLTSK